MRAALMGATEDINEAFQGGAPVGIPLCIPALENVIGRARPGDYLLIGARPSMGNSAVAIEIARRAAAQGTAVVY